MTVSEVAENTADQVPVGRPGSLQALAFAQGETATPDLRDPHRSAPAVTLWLLG